MYKNFLCTSIMGHTLSVILRHTLHVIHGCALKGILNHLLSVILGFIPRIHVKHPSLDTRDKPENDYKVMQCGRSMIEMLGVLAIIGVLSIGGIAGYSKAMIKFKTNTLLQQISTIISNTQILYAQQKNYEGLDNETAIQMEIIPAELISSDGETLVDSFGDELYFYGHDNEDVGESIFGIVSFISTKEKCLAMSNADWNVFNPYGVSIASLSNDKILSYCSDRYLEINGEGCDEMGKVVEKLPFSPSDVAEICSSCSVEAPCSFDFATE